MPVPQALRGSLLKKYAKIRNEIDRLHNSRMSPYEKTESLEAIRSHIMAAWHQAQPAGLPPCLTTLQHLQRLGLLLWKGYHCDA